jgi:hypothetical protein
MLFLLGASQAMLGVFWYSSGPVPLAAIGFDVAIFCSCVLGGWGMRRPLGGLAPAAGWFLAAFVLGSGTSGGSVLITATTAGSWLLFGGSASAAIGMVVVFSIWSGTGRSGAGLAGRRGTWRGLGNAPGNAPGGPVARAAPDRRQDRESGQ